MNIKKITAAALAAVLMAGTVSLTASAADAIGTNATTIQLGEKVSDTIPYDEDDFYRNNGGEAWESFHYDNGSNYKDFAVSTPKDGKLVLLFDVAIDRFHIDIYKADPKEEMNYDITTTTGDIGRGNGDCIWDSTAGTYVGIAQLNVVEENEYLVRIKRCTRYDKGGFSGSGDLKIAAQMKYAGDANNDGKINATDATAVLKHVVGIDKLSGVNWANADANGDGKINATDATTILKQVVGLS